jgi:hypothetical protein
MEHAAIDQLAATPEILRLIMAGVNDQRSQWKPSADRFSIAETLEHLSKVEGHIFRDRVDRILAEDNPNIEAYDTDEYFASGAYSNRDAEESFAHWEEQRESNIEILEELEPASLNRRARHARLGEITLGHVLNAWAWHDVGHIRQIAEIVRTLLYYPEMGPFQNEYTPKP